MTDEERRARNAASTRRHRARQRGENAPLLRRSKLTPAERKALQTEYNRAYYAANKDCRRAGKAEYLKVYYAENQAKLRAAAAAKYAANPEPARERARARYAANPDRIKAHIQAKRDADPEATRARRRAEHAANSEKLKAEYATNREAHRAKRSARMPQLVAAVRKWRRANPEKMLAFNHKRRARTRAGGNMTAAEIRALRAESGGVCAYCLLPAARMHVEHCTPLCRGGTNATDNCVMACATCNARKGQRTVLEFVCGLPILDVRPACVPERAG